MKYVWEVLKMVFISFEFVFFLLLGWIYMNYGNLFIELGDKLTKDPEVLKWIPAIPFALSCYCASTLMWKLYTPLSGSNKELYDWPDFWRFKLRSYFSIIISIFCAILAFGIWIFTSTLSHKTLAVLFTFALGESLINTACAYFSCLALRVIMEKDDE